MDKSFELDKFLKNFMGLEKAAQVYRTITLPLNVKILMLLAEKGKLTTTQIYTTLNLEQPYASQHIGALRSIAVIRSIRDGQNVYHELNAVRLKKIVQATDLFMENEKLLLPQNQQDGTRADPCKEA